jgi:exodeoxyribonuclease VII large subunit
MPDDKIYSVTEITREIKRVLHANFGAVWLEGEISGYKRHSSGHHYFTLKDASAQIPCVMWRMSASRLSFTPEDGIKVQAWGNLEVYEPAGRYQFIASLLRPAGVGDLQRAFEALVQKLRAEGLFEIERKRTLPTYPETVGIVTSADGAALQDMRTVAARRWPAATLVLAPVKVQGPGAAEEIAAAIEAFNRDGRADVLVIGRGGGSLEDLWAFNEEIVARAIFRSRIPVISAVGHEVDVTVADFVADVRAPTPSAAMEMLLPDREETAEMLHALEARLQRRRREIIRHLRNKLDLLSRHWALRQPAHLVPMAEQRLDDIRTRLQAAFSRYLHDRHTAVGRVRELITLFRPQAVLTRGYSIVRDASGTIIRSASILDPGAEIALTFAHGSADAAITKIHPEGTHESP